MNGVLLYCRSLFNYFTLNRSLSLCSLLIVSILSVSYFREGKIFLTTSSSSSSQWTFSSSLSKSMLAIWPLLAGCSSKILFSPALLFIYLPMSCIRLICMILSIFGSCLILEVYTFKVFLFAGDISRISSKLKGWSSIFYFSGDILAILML